MPTTITGQSSNKLWGEYIWIDRIGFIRIGDVVRGMMLVYILFTGIVTVVTSDLITLGFLVLLTVPILRKRWFVRFFPRGRTISVYLNEGMYVAKHNESGRTRHGETPQDALANITDVIVGSGGNLPID